MFRFMFVALSFAMGSVLLFASVGVEVGAAGGAGLGVLGCVLGAFADILDRS